MPLRYPTIDAWLLRQLKLLNDNWDNWHINTGEEGTGKSKWSRKVARRLDYLMRTPDAKVQLAKDGPLVQLDSVWERKFPLPRPFKLDAVRFGQDSLLDLLVELERCGVAIGDEIEGHKRLAMYGQRLELLDHTKEARALGHNVWLNFPQFTDFEKTLVRTRMRWWEENVSRSLVIVRERNTRTVFDRSGEPQVSVKWPIVARFAKTGDNDPWEPAYDAKKDARMRDRAARRRDGDDAEAPVQVKPAAVKRTPEWLLDEVLGELKK